jgi:lipopolysaccharide transport system ATP-binding protein
LISSTKAADPGQSSATAEDIVLSVSGLSKKFAKGLRLALAYGMRDIGRELWPGGRRQGRLRPGEFWALRDLSFDLKRGEALAIVGSNGAGKTTLLRILHGLVKPDEGSVRIRGTTEAILELGSGFNPVLSGRENVQLSAALHGLAGRESARLLDAVTDFAELEAFIDAPVQSYSSGMRARLAYALSAQLSPDLLLVDEALAVGDLVFQRKCINHMRTYLAGGGALLFVSHNVHQIQMVCQRGLLLDRGRLLFAGSAVDTLERMFESAAHDLSPSAPTAAPRGPVLLLQAVAEPLEEGEIRSGGPLRLRIRYECRERVEVVWGFSIWTSDQWTCVAGETDPRPTILEKGEGELSCVLPRIPLVAGRYALKTSILEAGTRLALATAGWTDAPLVLDVREQASVATNMKRKLGQLISLDVEWR